ncbi:MAG: AAA family ATPase [Gammaproteobacteria bacterium]|nr:AAA family ATPase [Gammaproteobacteria bacterium]MYH86029.1 AAA family ATPase [Gammaproteobacteria bacterium]MYK04112.1 AAA family ATPase [Gammaproteobacteria bacterium]
MDITFVEIQNFRKLKACRVEIAERETIFVGANNSGKTSAVDALILFLKKSRHKDFATTDFTLSNWTTLDQFGVKWVEDAGGKDEQEVSISAWLPLMPSIDVWLRADEKDLHFVVHLLPSLDWTPKELLGVRLVLAPRNIEQLYNEFQSAYMAARDAEAASAQAESPLSLWPNSMRDYLDKTLHEQFEIQSYILDPSQCQDPANGIAKPQSLPPDSQPLDRDPFKGLIRVDDIPAQRGFSDPKTEDESSSGFASLSTQLRNYFSKHLDPAEAPDASDISALEAIEEARAVFNKKLKSSFEPAIGELEGLNYPGFSDPKISVTSKINPRDSLNHDAAVQFELRGSESLTLPEQYNGLGYQNLISMVFRLIRFRDGWMRVGKAGKDQDTKDIAIEPLHVVLVEEPEAHLHVQIQQVFIKKAYEVLRSHAALENSSFSTQLIVSTHSPHIAHELDFSCLRYFRREPVSIRGKVPTATVVNLSHTFGDQDETSKFAARYLRTTHCDLFFADAAILVEGSAERMLIPHFVRAKFHMLDQSYISLLEIGGAHAHRLKPLLDTLGLLSLIVTDLDSIGATGIAKVRPERGENYRTGNSTLKKWVPKIELLDDLLSLLDNEKQTTNGLVRVAYQCPITVKYKEDGDEENAIPYTFEDSLALTNLKLFREYEDPVGLLKKLQAALGKDTLEDASKDMFDSLEKGSKAEMVLELIYLTEPCEVEPPGYIADGLKWLEENLQKKKDDDISSELTEVHDA